MSPRARKHQPEIPAHIDQAKIPKGVYWDPTGRGRWLVFEVEDGKKRSRTVAGPVDKLSDLFAITEASTESGTVHWVCDQYHESPKFKKLAKGTRDDYNQARDVMLACNDPPVSAQVMRLM